MVTKFCCPTCYEVLEDWRGKSSNIYCVRGHHSIIFPIGLPSLLDPKVIDRLVDQFEQCLYAEIQAFWISQGILTNHQKRTFLLQSDHLSLSGASTKSSKSVVRPTTADVLAAFQDRAKKVGQVFSGISKPVGTSFNRTPQPVDTSDDRDIQPVNTLVDIPVNSLVPEPVEVENKQKARKWSFLAIFRSKRKPLNFLKSQPLV